MPPVCPLLVQAETSEYTTQKGGTNFRTVAHFQMTLACTETGATYTSMWTGEAIDRSDKSISKAATSAVKYFLLKTFLLAGGDEDADGFSPVVDHAESPQVEVRKPAKAWPHRRRDAANGTSYHDDEMWEPDALRADAHPQGAGGHTKAATKKPDRLSQVQLARIHILGKDLHGKAWTTEGPALISEVSNQTATSSKELTPAEADVLIKLLESELRATRNGVPNAA